MKIKNSDKYPQFENSVKDLLKDEEFDIIDINIFANKKTNFLEIKSSQKETIKTILS